MYPVAGGWSGSYMVNDFKAQASAKNPIALVGKIVSILETNKQPVDVEDIRWQLESQWYVHSKKRFIRPPAQPKKVPQKTPLTSQEVSPTRVVNAICGFLNLSYRTTLSMEQVTASLIEVFESQGIDGKGCCQIVRSVAANPGDDWRYDLQAKLCEKFGLPRAPKPLIAKNWRML